MELYNISNDLVMAAARQVSEAIVDFDTRHLRLVKWIGVSGSSAEPNPAAPVSCIVTKARIEMHLHEKALTQMPWEALLGCLEFQLLVTFIKMEPEWQQFNFNRTILPLINVSGSATFYVRQITESIRKALIEPMAVKKIIQLNLGRHLIHYFFYRLNAIAAETDDYENLLNHNWQRSFFVLYLLGQYLSIVQIEQGLCQGFIENFWERYSFIDQDDHRLLEALAQKSRETYLAPLSDRLAELFITLRDNLLLPRGA